MVDYEDAMYINEEFECMSPEEVLEVLYQRYGDRYNPEDGMDFTKYEVCRLALKSEQANILRQYARLNSDMNDLLYLCELEDKCFGGIDMLTPMKPKIKKPKKPTSKANNQESVNQIAV